jgi:hypothetical protein
MKVGARSWNPDPRALYIIYNLSYSVSVLGGGV